MAKILVACTPQDGHTNPLRPLVAELTARGHEVRWYNGEKYIEQIERVGAVYEPMVEGYDFSLMPGRSAFPQVQGEGLAGFISSWTHVFQNPSPGYTKDLLSILERFPADAIISDDLFFGAGLAAEKAGLPWISIATTIYLYDSTDTLPTGIGLHPVAGPLRPLAHGFMNFYTNHVLLRSLSRNAAQIRRDMQLTPLPGAGRVTLVRQPDIYLMGTVPSFEYPRRDMLPQTEFVGAFVGAQTDTFEPPAWWGRLDDDRPVVHVTQGTVADNAVSLVAPTVRALADENVLVVATTGRTAPSVLGDLPENVIAEGFVPHDALLPKTDAMLTNGGYGGVQRALYYGVPLAVAGTFDDKPEVAARVAWSGAGVNLKTDTPTEAQIRETVRQLLNDPSYKANAGRIAAEHQQYNGPQLAADRIEVLLAERNPIRT